MRSGFLEFAICKGTMEEDELSLHLSKVGERFNFRIDNCRLYVGRVSDENFLGSVSVSRHRILIEFSSKGKMSKEHAQQLTRSVTFRTTGDGGCRIISVMMSDGVSFDHSLWQVAIEVVFSAEAVHIASPTTRVTFALGTDAVFLAPSAQLERAISTENQRGYLIAEIAHSKPWDHVFLNPNTNGTSQLGILDTGVVVFEGQEVATVSHDEGALGTGFIRVNLQDAPLSAVVLLIRSLCYSNKSLQDSGTKTLKLTLKTSDVVAPGRLTIYIDIRPLLLQVKGEGVGSLPGPRFLGQGVPLFASNAVHVHAPDETIGFVGGRLTAVVQDASLEQSIVFKGKGGLAVTEEGLVNAKGKVVASVTTIDGGLTVVFGNFIDEDSVVKLIKGLTYQFTGWKLPVTSSTVNVVLIVSGHSASVETVIHPADCHTFGKTIRRSQTVSS